MSFEAVPVSRFRSAKVERKAREGKKKDGKMHFSAFVVAALKIGLDKLSIVARKTDAQQFLAPAGSGMKEGECDGFLLISEDDNLKICPHSSMPEAGMSTTAAPRPRYTINVSY